MTKLPIIAGAAASVLLLASASIVQAAPLPAAPGSADYLILVGDEENAEVQNELEPETDKGTPMRDERAMEKAPPQGTGESAEKALEETVGGDGINAIQRESIPPE